jgi:hypothetical protein
MNSGISRFSGLLLTTEQQRPSGRVSQRRMISLIFIRAYFAMPDDPDPLTHHLAPLSPLNS